MKTPKYYKERAEIFANYIVKNKVTSTQAADFFMVSSYLIRQEIHKWLPDHNPTLYAEVKEAFKGNQGAGFTKTTIKCELSNCKYNTAKHSQDVGFCTRNDIEIKFLSEHDCGDCATYKYFNKGKDFYKKVSE